MFLIFKEARRDRDVIDDTQNNDLIKQELK